MDGLIAGKDGGAGSTLDGFGQDAVLAVIVLDDFQIVVADFLICCIVIGCEIVCLILLI
jgi:hypothetical protein